MHWSALLGLEWLEASIIGACLAVTLAACIEAINDRREIIRSGINHGTQRFANSVVKVRLYMVGIMLAVLCWAIDSIFIMQGVLYYPRRFIIYGFFRMMLSFFTVAIIVTNRRSYGELVDEARKKK